MLKRHRQTAEHMMNIFQFPGESDLEYRKRVFLHAYPYGDLFAVEALFAVNDWRNLSSDDKRFMEKAKQTFDSGGMIALRALVDSFAEDPRRSYAPPHENEAVRA
ncbi:MAG: hypothetical protein WDN09_04235 [bacterium]